MNTLDLSIVLGYVVAMFGIGMFVGLRETADDFLVLSRRAGFVMVMFSVVSTWVGVGVFVGTAAAGYDSGISFGATGAAGALVAVLSAGMFAPVIKRFGDRYHAHTLGDFYRVRYSPAGSKLSGGLIVVIYIIFTAVQFTGLSDLLRVWTGLSFEAAVLLTAVSTVVYTAFAGIKSDFYTDVIHFTVMAVVLFAVLLPQLFDITGGFTALRSLPSSYFDLFSFGGPAYFVGGLVIGTGIVFVSMEVWQRIYASTNAQTARSALIGSAFLIVPFYILAALVGISARSIYGQLPDRDLALFVIMRDFLPRGFLGLGVAAFVALFVSSVNTMIMVVSATITKDFLGSSAGGDQRRMLRTARSVTLAVGFAGLALSYVVRDIVTLSVVAFFMLLILLPSVVGGFFWKRATNKGACWSIVGGAAVSVVVIPINPNTAFVPAFIVSIATFVVVSFLTEHDSSEVVLSGKE